MSSPSPRPRGPALPACLLPLAIFAGGAPREFTARAGAGPAIAARSAGGPAPLCIALFHGGPGLSRDYLLPFERLAIPGRRCVLAWDQRGGGRSEAPADGDYSLEAHVADAAAVAAAAGNPRLILVGHSWGALPAIRYARLHPDRVVALVLIDAMAPTRAAWSEAQTRFGARAERLRDLGILPAEEPACQGDCTARLRSRLPVYFHDPRHPAARELGGTISRREPFLGTLSALGEFDLRADAAALTIPVLSIYGAGDPFGPENHAAMLAALPDTAAYRVLPECGHLPWAECPEPFWAALERWLAPRAPAR